MRSRSIHPRASSLAVLLLAAVAFGAGALPAQTIVQLEHRRDFESTYDRKHSLDYILISHRGLELGRLLAAALAHAEATGDSGYNLFFESLRTFGRCVQGEGRRSCYAPGRPRFRTGAEEDRFTRLSDIYANAYYRILQVQGQARISLNTRDLKPALDAFERAGAILGDFSLNREHSIDTKTIRLLRALPVDSEVQPIPDASLYLIFLRAVAALPREKLVYRPGHDLPAHTGGRRVDRLKAYLRKAGLRQVLYRVPGSLRNLASNM